MMTTDTFLRRILPPDGYYASLVIGPDGRPRQKFYATVDELAARVVALSDTGHNTYYAVASFVSDTGGRKVANIHAIKALFLDVDCGPDKPLASWREGLRAVGDFVTQNALPKPMIVASGNGLHVYWPLATAVSYAEWHPYAMGLKALIPVGADGTPLFDPTVSADGARVLRPVGTTNSKGGNTVRLLIDAPDIELEDLANLLEVPTAKPAAPASKARSTSAILSAMAVPSDFPPANADKIASLCAQVRWATENQAQVKEPLWYALMGIASACEDPEQTAVRWSDQHPGFDQGTTLAKLQQWRDRATGPATCARFEQERPNGCAGCKFAGRIGTPARLGVESPEVAPAQDAPDPVVQAVPLPRPFKRTATGIVVVIDNVEVDVCRFDIYPVGYGRDEALGYETVRYQWRRPHVGWQPLSFRQAFLTDNAKREFATALADQGIVLSGAKQTEYFQYMLRAYMDELRSLRAMTNLYSTMGWKTNHDQFLLGDSLFERDQHGNVTVQRTPPSSVVSRSIEPMYAEAGTLERWAAFTAVLERVHMPAHMFAILVSMSAPLYDFSGLRGLTVNLYGPTGSGKTLAQHWQQSVWGDPAKLHYAAKFTQNALFARIATANHMPVTIDETTMLPAKEIGDFLYWVSQGRDKARLTRSADEREAKTWATVVTTSSNRSMMSMLASTGLETDAQMARLLELTLMPHPLFVRDTTAGQKIYTFLSTNYGTAGRAFLTAIMSQGAVGIRAMIEDHRKRFGTKYGCSFSGAERYWEQCVMLADLAGEIAAETGIVRFDPRPAIRHVIDQLGASRRVASDMKTDAFDIVAEFMNEHAGSTITVFHTGHMRQPDMNRLPRGEVRMRLDLYRNAPAASFTRGLMLIDRTYFRRWLSNRGVDYRMFIGDLTTAQAHAPVRNDKAYLGKDTPIKIGQQYVLGIDLSHSRFSGVLSDAEEASLQAVGS
jgi:hypothetical protein